MPRKKKETTDLAVVETGLSLDRQFEYWNVTRGALAKKPEPSEIKINKYANNSQFLPIGTIENKLDLIFNGAWKTHSFETKVVANEIIGSIILEVFIPKVGWISRVGAGAVQIQMTQGSKITDFNAKIKNTLTKDFPHLKSECIKNACKSLGSAFGRDLNREETTDFGIIFTETNLLKRAKTMVVEVLTIDKYGTDEYSPLAQNIYKTFEPEMTDVEKKELHNFMKKHKIRLKDEKEQEELVKVIDKPMEAENETEL